MARKYDASTIVSIEDDRERIIKRPTNFIPSTNVEGALHIIFEIFDNALDEQTVVDAVGNSINVLFDEKNKDVTISDDGRGIPIEKMKNVCTVLYTSGKYDNTDETAYQTSGGTNGIGLKLAVFLSDYCNVTSMRDGKQLKYSFENGLLVDEKLTKSKLTGTVVNFRLSKKYLDVKKLTSDMIKQRLQEKSYLFPDIKIRYIVTNGDKEIGNYLFKGKTIVDKIKEFGPDTEIIYTTQTVDVTYVDRSLDNKPKNEKVKVEVAFAFKEDVVDCEKPGNYIISYGNTIKTTTGGMHVEGLRDGIIKFFRKELLERMSKKEKETFQVAPMDMVSGLTAFVSVKVNEPEFRGQYKDQLSNVEAKYAVRDAVYKTLEAEKDATIKRMCDFIKVVSKSRAASKKIRKKDVSNAFSDNKINKYFPFIKNINTTWPELVIVEGDSAAGSAMPGRDKFNQGIYSITGRPNNMIDSTSSAMEQATTAFNDIIDIAGCGMGKNYDESRLQIERLILLPDADTDGDGITVGLLGLIAKFTPGLIESGRVYRAVPPLYSFKEGKKMVHVSSQREFFKYLKKKFSGNVELYKRGKKYTEDEIMTFLEINFDYNKKLEKLSKRYSADPKFMEYMALKYKIDSPDTKDVKYWKEVMDVYRDITVKTEAKYIVIDGTYRDDYIHIVMDSYFEHNVKKFKECQRRNLFINGYSLNNKDNLSIHDVMKEFDKYIPDQLIRRKGLGELNPSELGKLCMDPKNRTLIKVKFKDVPKDMELIYIILSSKNIYKNTRAEILLNKVADDMEIDT